MLRSLVLCAVLLCAAAAASSSSGARNTHLLDYFGAMITGGKLHPNERYGGTKCAGCVIATTLVERLALVHDTPIEQEVQKLCGLLPAIIREPCDLLIADYGSTIIRLLEEKETPDAVCLAIKFCGSDDGGPKCRLFSAPDNLERERAAIAREQVTLESVVEKALSKRKTLRQQALETPWEWLKKQLERVFNTHTPLVDLDGDLFSTMAEFRGYHWRGRDCNDFDSKIYPGRKVQGSDPSTDYNCNGIKGIDTNTSKTWEEVLCSGTKQFGLVALGDSATAHFHIPPSYMNATEIDEHTYANLVEILMDEFDWPAMSASTAFETQTWAGTPKGPVHSIYEAYKQRNLCMHRDYQNIGVNGARVSSMGRANDGIINSFKRSATDDYPVIIEFALIGNDVCDHQHSVGHETKPADFKRSVVQSLDYLERTIPAGSHVNFWGLANGTILFDTMHARIHPLGAVLQDVTYADLYDFMNCLDISPCWGWMNSNATIRQQTQQVANELSNVYLEIIRDMHNYTKFDMHYFPLDFNEIVTIWQQKGGQAWQLIEPVDGFHPSQIGVSLLAQLHVQIAEKKYPEILPPINPNNEKIAQLFGDQGGY